MENVWVMLIPGQATFSDSRLGLGDKAGSDGRQPRGSKGTPVAAGIRRRIQSNGPRYSPRRVDRETFPGASISQE